MAIPLRLACALVLGSSMLPALARAQQLPATEVDTGDQAAGVAPRIDLELGIQFHWGFGDPCRQDGDVRSCEGSFPILGGQLLAELRPWSHVALGPVLAYDHKLFDQTIGGAGSSLDYSRHMWRLMLELRWYSRRVAKGGFFIAARGGVAWLTDSFSPVGGRTPDSGATQSAPVFGLGVGGAFVPYRGLGAVLALQGFLAPFSDSAPTLPDGGKAYAYGFLAFIGASLSLTIGTGL